MLYSAKHRRLASAYKRSYEIIYNNTRHNIPPSLRALDDHQCALLKLRDYLDSIGVKMPIPQYE